MSWHVSCIFNKCKFWLKNCKIRFLSPTPNRTFFMPKVKILSFVVGSPNWLGSKKYWPNKFKGSSLRLNHSIFSSSSSAKFSVWLTLWSMSLLFKCKASINFLIELFSAKESLRSLKGRVSQYLVCDKGVHANNLNGSVTRTSLIPKPNVFRKGPPTTSPGK